MSGLKRTTEKNMMVFSGRAHAELAEEVAELLGIDAEDVDPRYRRRED